MKIQYLLWDRRLYENTSIYNNLSKHENYGLKDEGRYIENQKPDWFLYDNGLRHSMKVTVWLGETLSGFTKVNPQVTMENFEVSLSRIV